MIVLVAFPNHGVMGVKVSKVIQRLRKVTQRDLDLKVSRDGFNTLQPLSDDTLPVSLNTVFDSFWHVFYNFTTILLSCI